MQQCANEGNMEKTLISFRHPSTFNFRLHFNCIETSVRQLKIGV